jgi:hypothetical protein
MVANRAGCDQSGPDARPHEVAERIDAARRVEASFDSASLDETVPSSRSREREILLVGDELGDNEIVDLEAQPARAARAGTRHDDEPVFPSVRESRGSRRNALRVVAERVVERGELADGSVHEAPPFGLVPRVHVGFHRSQHLGRRGGKLSEHRLAPQHHDLVVFGDRRRRPDDVLELVARHALRRSTSRRTRHRSRASRVPANGLTCRRSFMRSDRSTSAEQTSAGEPARMRDQPSA